MNRKINRTQTYESKQTFVDVPHNSSVVDRARHHKVSITSPADVIHIFYVSSKKKIVRWAQQINLHIEER